MIERLRRARDPLRPRPLRPRPIDVGFARDAPLKHCDAGMSAIGQSNRHPRVPCLPVTDLLDV